MPNEADLALCRRVAAGDRAAFRLLVEANEAPLRSFLARMGCAEPDDIAQEAFVKAWRAIGQYDGRARFATWLTRIAWRAWLDRLPRRQVAEAATGDLPLDPHLPHQLASLLAALPPRERAVLLLCDGEGWTHAEAAAMLGLPLGTLKSIAARAKATARALWTGTGDA